MRVIIKNRFFAVALVTLLMTISSILWIAKRGVPVVLQTNLENLPLNIAGFHGSEDSFSPAIYEELNADLNVYRHYRSPEGKQVDLYIGYYGTAKGGRTGHNPYACLSGAGWGIIEQGEVEVFPMYRQEGVTLNYVVARKDGINNVILNWYQSAGTQVLGTGLQQNIQRFLGRVLHNRNDGAYVQVFSFAEDPEVPRAKEVVRHFALNLLELLPDYWPAEG
jgi:EpsI family protein